MQTRSAPLGTAVVGLVLALFFTTRPTAPRPAGETKAKGAADSVSKEACKADASLNYLTGARLISRFLGKETPTPEAALAQAHARGYNISVLIATLPDPTDSRLDWGFDFDLDAIRRAHERTGLVVDRFWLPWVQRGGSSAKTICAGGQSLWAVRPGVMLFRGRTRLHVLYLVGEIPTSGVHKAALREALDERALLTRGESEASTVRLVGPLFSGSTISLAMMLKSWLQEASESTQISVVSGSATSLNNLEVLRDPRITFSATVNPDPALLNVLTRVVACRLDLPPSRVALLSEASTAYGRELNRTGAERSVGACPDVGDEDMRYLRMTYPLSISSLRAEYQRHPEAEQPGISTPGAPTRPRLPLNLGDPSGLTEAPPIMSELTPPAVDLLLDGITRTLRDNDIRAVGVLGTDVRDKLFLAEEIRRRMRDVQLFTFSSNVLLSRPEYSNSLRGMLVLSTYPLLPENQRWTGGANSENRRDLFPSDAAQGEYNATLVQLGYPAAAIDYRAPFDTNSTATRPPVWLTLIGRGASLPLAIDPSPPYAQGYVHEVSQNSGTPSTDRSAVGALVFLWTLAVGTAVLALAWHLIMRRSVSQRERWTRDDKDETGEAATALLGAYQGFQYLHGELYVVMVLFALVGVFVPTAALLLLARFEGLPMVPGIVAFLLACLVLFAVSRRFRPVRNIYDEYRDDIGAYWKRSRKWLSLTDLSAHVIALTLGIAYLILVLSFVWSMAALSGERFVFFFRRSVAVESGLSPLAPTLLIGVIITAWALWHRDRISLLQRFTEFEAAALRRSLSKKEGTSGGPDSAFTQASGRVLQIRNSLFLLAPDRWSAALLGLTLALGLALWWQFDRTVESIALLENSVRFPSSFDMLFRFGLLTGIGLTTWCLYRFVSIWRQFIAFLDHVRTMPIISAFDRLPQRFARVTRPTLSSAVREPAVESMVDMQCSHLHRVYEHGALEKDEESAARRLAISRAMNELRDPISTERTDALARPQHGRQFTALYRALEECWATEPTDAEVARLATHFADPSLSDEALKRNTTGRFRRMFGGSVGLWVRAAEELAASEVVEYIDWVLRHLFRLAFVLLAIVVLVTVLISSYPFQPHSTIKVIFFGLVLITAITLVAALIQMNRDEVLSRVTKTRPGAITWDTPFVLNVALFGVVPLLVILSAEFPAIRSILFAWVEPLFRAVARG